MKKSMYTEEQIAFALKGAVSLMRTRLHTMHFDF